MWTVLCVYQDLGHSLGVWLESTGLAPRIRGGQDAPDLPEAL